MTEDLETEQLRTGRNDGEKADCAPENQSRATSGKLPETYTLELFDADFRALGNLLSGNGEADADVISEYISDFKHAHGLTYDEAYRRGHILLLAFGFLAQNKSQLEELGLIVADRKRHWSLLPALYEFFVCIPWGGLPPEPGLKTVVDRAKLIQAR
jgi:hypothetical protein